MRVKVPRGTKVVVVSESGPVQKPKPRMKVRKQADITPQICHAGVCKGMKKAENYRAICHAGVCKGMNKAEAIQFITEKHGSDYLEGWLERMKEQFW